MVTMDGFIKDGISVEYRQNQLVKDRIILNVSGLRFETKESTLARFPNTLLGCKEKREKYFDQDNQEYFFGRSRQVFDSILFYYQSDGRLIRPLDVPEPLFVNELRFFEIGDPENQCSFSEKVDRIILGTPLPMPESRIQRLIWQAFTYPETSKVAQVIGFWNVLTLILSIGLACAETVPSLRVSNRSELQIHHRVLYWLEVICYAWFTLEYLVRFACAYGKWPFIRNALNLIDLVALVPFYLQLIIESNTSMTPLTLLRVIRLVRIIRLLKFSRYSRGMRALLFTLYESWADLQLLGLIMIIVTTVSASLVYYAESHDSNSLIVSIPESMWWAMNTLTTVGYGDTYPSTGVGKILGGLFSMLGTILLGLPIYCLISNFLKLWESLRHQKLSESLKEHNLGSKLQDEPPYEDEDEGSNHSNGMELEKALRTGLLEDNYEEEKTGVNVKKGNDTSR